MNLDFWVRSLKVKDLELKKILKAMVGASTNERVSLQLEYKRREDILNFVRENPEYKDAPEEWLRLIVEEVPGSYDAAFKILDIYK